jgi:hypothetical protein
MMIGLEVAERIAEQYLVGRSADSGLKLVLHRARTLEREFGWVFYYGPEDKSVTVTGNAPFIVNRNDGTIHLTGTALPTEIYLENYARTGTAFRQVSLSTPSFWKAGGRPKRRWRKFL